MLPLVLVKGKWFNMGSEEGQDDERPVHRVWVDAFALGSSQVTNAEYAAFLEATGHRSPPTWNDSQFNHPKQPVVAVSWFDAAAYCGWLTTFTGASFRLPTEAEWECAARGGAEGKLYPWGDEPPESQLNYDSRWRRGPEQTAGGAPASLGLYDICENVHEWCSDWYQADYYRASPERNPRGPQTGTRRVSRGGSWRHQVKISRCAARSSIPPQFQYTDYGFRIARDLE